MDKILTSDINIIKNKIKQYKQEHSVIGFVPTMGCLHEGHLQLIKNAASECDKLIVSIFVNPKQFNNQNDYINYPKVIDKDIKLLEDRDVAIIFTPLQEMLYPRNYNISILVNDNKLCAANRKGHFDGVALILCKLFNIIMPDIAYFGLKDYQQYLVVKDLVSLFNYNIDIRAVETVREESGLALSSRNNLLSEHARHKIAPLLYQELLNLKSEILANKFSDIPYLVAEKTNKLLKLGFTSIDYLEILNADLSDFSGNLDTMPRLFVAAYIDNVRLIDNIAL
jgi:pantoate--beta-alanine ligase